MEFTYLPLWKQAVTLLLANGQTLQLSQQNQPVISIISLPPPSRKHSTLSMLQITIFSQFKNQLNNFKKTHSRYVYGRYVVRLPLNSLPCQLGNSYTSAQRCLKSFLNRISKNQTYSDLYHTFLQEYEDLNHMTRAPSSHHASSSSPVYYLPHHGVLRNKVLQQD